MIRKKNKSTSNSQDISVYASRYDIENVSLTDCNEDGMPSKVAKQLIEDELTLETTPVLNLASFVTTWMEPEANDLIMKCINKNFIDHDEYPQMEKFHERCVHIIAGLLHAPKAEEYVGTATIGSSEAIMLAGLSYRFNWKHRTNDTGKPNIVMGANVQICWDKFARYFDVEPRIIPLEKGKYTITAKDVEPLLDENTICVAAILGTTFTGEYDEIKEINDMLLRIKKIKGWDIPIHVDGASGGFIAMFHDTGIKWDFKLEQVKSINISGHKYGLVYPGVGWLIFRDESVVHKDLVFHVNYLGGNMPTYTLNFSRGSSMIVAQYYNFLRLGKKGYRKIIENMMFVSNTLVKELTATGEFEVLGKRRMLPVVTVALKDPSNYTVFDISEKLRVHGWVVPAYTMPKNAQDVAVLRIVVKENMSMTLANDFLNDVRKVLQILKKNSNAHPKQQTNASGKNKTH